MSEHDLSRRDALKVLGAATAASVTPLTQAPGKPAPKPQPHEGPRGTPSDPVLLRPKISWPKVLTPSELATLSVLCDVIIPADDKSPSASAVGVPDYINEWASAPYYECREGLVQIRGGLVWLNAESHRRFGKPFAELRPSQHAEICDLICYPKEAKPEHQAMARFFDVVRDLTATGFYTTREGMKDVGYVGNVPLQRFEGPPAEVLRKLGIPEGPGR
jgi:gluconate 2-dehydrogenase gamma chain